jgi:NADH dehydrogenase [ubiquinone] 1 alpha subcomplex assembly factor 6
MQYWRDAISASLAPNTTPKKEPVAVLLAHAAATLRERTGGRARLSPLWFQHVLNAREARLADPPYADLDALERYAEATYASLLYATLGALPVQSVAADHVASHIGKAAGIAAVLRGLPLVAFPNAAARPAHQPSASPMGAGSSQRQGTVLLPLDVMAEYGVREEDVLREGGAAVGLRDAVFAVATRANDHLITARELLKNFKAGEEAGHEFEHAHEEGHGHDGADESAVAKPASEKEAVEKAFGVFMPAVPTALWLQQLEKVDFDIFDPKLRVSDWRLPWKAYWAYSTRRI